MHPTDTGPLRPKKRIPKWLTITLAVFGLLFILGAVFGKASDKTAPAAATPQPSPTSAAATTTSPAAVTYTVASVTNGATLEVTGSDGTRKTVRVFGVIAPLAGTGCYAAETLAWATAELTGKAVALGTETAQGVTVTLTGGVDYATAALESGYVKYATAAGSLPLEALESTARTAAKGLWGAPCNGTIDAPTPAPPTVPTTKAAPNPPPPVETTEEPPADPPADNVYYKNCTDAKAHGATNIHRGEPGYRRELDRNNDGVACES